MNRNFTTRIALAVLVTVMSAGVSYAKPTSSKSPSVKTDPVQTQNTRHKTPHADRKAAAKHLKLVHQQKIQTELTDSARRHKGFSGRGRAH